MKTVYPLQTKFAGGIKKEKRSIPGIFTKISPDTQTNIWVLVKIVEIERLIVTQLCGSL